MLLRLEIRDFALLEHAVFEPGPGLVVLTGETGAGKSLLLDALGSLTGKRVSKDWIRSGKELALIEACFDLSDQGNLDRIAEILNVERSELVAEGQLVLSREIRLDGRSLARINGRLSNLSLLKAVSSHLVGIHGQHEQQEIFDPKSHQKIIDRYGAETISPVLGQWRDLLKQRKDLLHELKSLGLTPQERDQRIDLLNFQLAELEGAAVQPEEDEKLGQRNKLLSASLKVLQEIDRCRGYLIGERDEAAISQLHHAVAALEYAGGRSKQLADLREELMSVTSKLTDLAHDLAGYRDRLLVDPAEVEKTNQRLALLDKLKAKYGPTLADVLQYEEMARDELQALSHSEELFIAKRQELASLEKDLATKASELLALRQSAAEEISQKIIGKLAELGMKDIQFTASFTDAQPKTSSYYAPEGRAVAEFLISPNPGEPVKPLAKIASGGEASRILLAIKAIIADCEDFDLLIFDEIDTGISGGTADKLAKMLQDLASNRQVLCVSHMAQTVAAADEQWQISKHTADQRTFTELTKLDADQSLAEIARLLSGNSQDRQALDLARTMRDKSERS